VSPAFLGKLEFKYAISYETICENSLTYRSDCIVWRYLCNATLVAGKHHQRLLTIYWRYAVPPGRSKMDSSGRSRFASGQISSFTCGAGSVPTLSKPNSSANTKIDLDERGLSRSHFISSTFSTNTGQGYHDVLGRPPALDVPLDAFGTP
jgi:hypothetical protein